MPNTVRLHRVLATKPENMARSSRRMRSAKWLPPNGFACAVHHLDAKVGGTHRMSFRNFTTGDSHAFGGEYSINPRSWFSFLSDNPDLFSQFNKSLAKGLGGTILGTEWGLQGEISIGDQKAQLEGSTRVINHLNLEKSVENFFNDTTAKNGSALANMAQEDKVTIMDSLKSSATYDLGDAESMKRAFEDYKAGKPVTISTGWEKHAIEVTLHNGFLAITNRGERPIEINLSTLDLKSGLSSIFDSKNLNQITDDFKSTIEKIKDTPIKKAKTQIFQIQGEVTEKLFQKLLANPTHDETDDRMKWFDKTIKDELKLVPFCDVPKSDQKVGNCGWANTKGGFHTELILLQLDRNLKAGMPMDEAKAKAVQSGTEIFKEWELYHRCKSLESLREMEKDLNKPNFLLTRKQYETLINKVLDKIDVKELRLEEYTKGNYTNTTAPESVKRMRELASELGALSQACPKTQEILKIKSCFSLAD